MKSFDDSCEKLNSKIKLTSKKINEKSVRASNGFFDNQRANIALILVVAIAGFFLMFLMNSSTPYVAEDFDYHYIFADDGNKITDERIESISDIVTSMKAHYKTMNGRIVTHSIVQLIMLLDKKAVFNVINSLVYVMFTFLVYKHCVGKSKKQNVFLFLFINICVWMFVPQWGMTTVWLLGSVNYLWMSVVRLVYLISFRLYAEDGQEKKSFLKIIPMFVLGFLAGNSSENMGAALVGVSILFLTFYRIKKYKFKIWQFTGLLGLILGYCFMFFAPANSRRIAQNGGNTISSILSRIVNIPANAIYFLAPLFGFILVALFVLFKTKSTRKIGVSFIYFLGAVGGVAVMFAIPFFPRRAWFGIVIYMIMSAGILIHQIDLKKNESIRQIIALVTVVCCAWTLMSYAKAYQSAEEYMDCWDERIEYIEEQKKLGNYDLEFPNIQVLNDHAPLYSWTDIGRAENDPQHISIARFFGLNSIDWNHEFIIIE